MPHRAPPGSDGVGPKRVVVVGAGMVGLATAWFLQEYGVEVTVVDGNGVGTGSSWGNAGWICPGLVTPLAEPSVLRYGLRSLVDPTSALYVPPTFDVALWRFLVGFARHCTIGQWRRAMSAYVSLNGLALDAFDELRIHPPHEFHPIRNLRSGRARFNPGEFGHLNPLARVSDER